ncbi:hypothetical protein LOZ43_006838 [Ophidiomyces ophidiicola]|nr:hypothetical protein LOZ43_006838 [Ophidiomyces ophidiicola]
MPEDQKKNFSARVTVQEVQFDLQAVALDKAFRALHLDADPTAPTELPDHMQAQFDNDPKIQELAPETRGEE